MAESKKSSSGDCGHHPAELFSLQPWTSYLPYCWRFRSKSLLEVKTSASSGIPAQEGCMFVLFASLIFTYSQRVPHVRGWRCYPEENSNALGEPCLEICSIALWWLHASRVHRASVFMLVSARQIAKLSPSCEALLCCFYFTILFALT